TQIIFGADVHIYGAVCVYLLVATVVSALLFGLAPAWISARVPAQEGLREGTSGGGVSRKQVFWRDALVVGEITLTLALLIAAGLMMRTLLALRHAEEGFVAENVVSGNMFLPTHGAWWAVGVSRANTNLITSFYQPLMERLKHTPGIAAAGLTTVRPLQPNWRFSSE